MCRRNPKKPLKACQVVLLETDIQHKNNMYSNVKKKHHKNSKENNLKVCSDVVEAGGYALLNWANKKWVICFLKEFILVQVLMWTGSMFQKWGPLNLIEN